MIGTRVWRTVSAVLAGALVLAGCGPGGFSGAYNFSLPGGPDLGEDPFTVTARFDSVLNLVPQASVKVDSVPVGTVTGIELSDDTTSAVVTMNVNNDVDLPANATAKIRQESVLGAKFVALASPSNGKASGTLSDGDRIAQQSTGSTAEIEEVFGALSLLLSGGGVEEIRTIADELNKALGGNEAEIRALLSRADRIATQLDAERGDIVRAIEGLDKLSKTLRSQDEKLKDALDNLGPGLKVLNQQQDSLVEMLDSLHELADVSVEVMNKSGQQVVENLRTLEPILKRLAESGKDLPNSMRILPTYPYPAYAGRSIHGDYANVDVKVDLRLDSLIENFQGYERGVGDELPDTLSDLERTPGDPSELPLPKVDTTDDSESTGKTGNESGSDGGDSSGLVVGELLESGS